MAKMLPGSKEVFEPIVVTHDPINNPPTATHDLRRQHHNEVQEPTELRLKAPMPARSRRVPPGTGHRSRRIRKSRV